MNAVSAPPVSCPGLATTGSALFAPLALGAAVLIAGCFLVLLARTRRDRAMTAVVLLLLLAAALTVGLLGQSSAQASTPTCGGPTNSLAITQTSRITELAPGRASVAITGTVVNNGPHSTFIAIVTASVFVVTKAPAAAAGTCDATDYLLLHPAMRVGRTLAPGESVRFAGARLGFSDKASNQDACERAVLHLRYVIS